MVNNKIAQRAVAAGMSGLMAFGAAAPAALAYTPQDFKWYKVSSNDDGVYWKRLSGDDRYGTMKEIVKAYNEFEQITGINIYGKKTESDYNYHATAVIASGDNFPDALAANGLAGYLTNMNLTVNGGSNGSVPVTLTKSGKLSNEAKDLLKYMQVQEAIVMGGTAAISQDVEDAIAKMGIRVSRIAGKDRQETSLKALQAINGNWKGRKGTWDLIIATGDNYADALSISPYAYRMGTPIVLTKKDGTLTDAQVEAIRSNDDIKEILIVGGTSAVSDQVMGQIGTINKNKVGVQYNRIAGADRYETNAKIAQFEVDAWRSLWNGIKGFTFDHAIFSGYNEWSPSPLLLVKDGDLRAESTISWGLNRDRVATSTSTYASFATWVNTVNGWYGNSTLEWEKLYGDTLTNSAFHAWYDGAGPLYISDKEIEGVLPAAVADDAYSKTEETVTYKIASMSVGGATLRGVTEVTVENSISGKSYKLTSRADATPNTIINNAEGFFWNTADMDATTPGVQPGIEYWYTDDVTGIKYLRTLLKTDGTANSDAQNLALTLEVRPTAAELANDGTYSQKRTVWDATTRPLGTSTNAQIGAWATEVIGCVDVSEDFYGIILGGTAAVSNKKRDDLDDVVKANTWTDNVYTVGGEYPDTVVNFSEDWGINLNYSRLIPVATAKENKVVYNGQAAGSLRADVYRVAGTGSYVLIVTRKGNGQLLDWIYYPDPTSTVAGGYKNVWE